MFDSESNCAMNAIMFKKVRDKVRGLLENRWEIPKVIACIHDLWHNYRISAEQENELYTIADPNEQHNDCWKYWYEMDFDNPLMEI